MNTIFKAPADTSGQYILALMLSSGIIHRILWYDAININKQYFSCKISVFDLILVSGL